MMRGLGLSTMLGIGIIFLSTISLIPLEKALSDSLVNNVSDTITFDAGSSSSFKVKIVANTAQSQAGDPEEGCNIDGSTNVHFNVSPEIDGGLTASPNPMTFTRCNAFQDMTLSSLVGGAYSVTATVDPDPDGGEYHLQPFDTVQVVVVGSIPNTPPNLSPDPIPDQQASEGASFTLVVRAVDPDSGQTLTFEVLGAPAWLEGVETSVPSQLTLSGTPGESDGGTTSTVTIEVSDGNGGTDSDTFDLSVGETNQNPNLSAIPTPITVNEGDIATFDANVTDSDIPAQTLTFSLGSGAPASASFDTSTGVFSWPTTEADGPISYTFDVRVSDGPATVQQSVTIIVSEVNSPPTLAAIGSQTVNELDLVTFNASGNDADLPAQAINYSLIGAPAGASIDSTSGAFSWQTTVTDGPGIYTFTVRVTDGLGAFAEQQVTITVKGYTKVIIDSVLSQYEDRPINILSRLVDNDTGVGYAGKSLDVTSSPSSGTQSITTGKVNITSPDSSPIVLQHCETVAFGEQLSPSFDCARDDNQVEGDDTNEVIRIVPDTTIEFEDQNALVNLIVTGVGDASFILEFTSEANEVFTPEPFTVQQGGYAPANYGFPSGSPVAKVRFVSITQGSTLGVSSIDALQLDAEKYLISHEDFESYPESVTSLPSSAEVAKGFASAIVQMPDSEITVTVQFDGDSILIGSEESVSISMIDTDLAANGPLTTTGALSPIQVPVPVGDKDLDFLPDQAEIDGFMSTPAGTLYLWPGAGPSNPKPAGYNLDPDHKNMIVELDYCTGRAMNANVESLLVNAFAQVNVANPDKTPGIILKIFNDEQLPVGQGCSAVTHIFTDSDGTPLNSLEEIRQKYVGTSAVHGATPLASNTLAQYWASTHFYAVVGVTAGSGNLIDCTQAPYGVAVNPPGRTAFVGLGCSPHGATDPNFAGAKFGNDWQYAGTVWHELWHLLGSHHNGPVEVQNYYPPAVADTALTKTTLTQTLASSVTGTAGTKVLTLTSGNVKTSGPYQGYLTVQTKVTLNAATTITGISVTQVSAPNTALNMQVPLVLVTGGAGTSIQTLTWYLPMNVNSPIASGVTAGVWRATLTTSTTLKVAPTVISSSTSVSLVPDAIKTQNCLPQHISGGSYSMTYPDNIDKTIYFLADGITYNSAYDSNQQKKWKLQVQEKWITTLINEAAAAESQGVKGSDIQQTGVYAYGGATRLSKTYNTYVGAVPIWVDWNGDAKVNTLAADVNNFGKGGCGATPGQVLRANFPEGLNVDFYPSVTNGLVILRSDHTDNTAESSSVIYTSDGFLSPINPDGSGVFSIGDTIPVKLKVYENGVALPDITTMQFRVVLEDPLKDVTPTGKKSGGNLFRSENQGDQYIFNWNTKGLGAGKYFIFAVLDDQTIAYGELRLQ